MPDEAGLTTTYFPDYLSFDKLRETGIEHLEDLGTALWTDFNVHDPGITILEVLCYALTDLGYRTNLPVEDLLAPRPEAGSGADDDNFFTARQILTCNPVTVQDFRRLLIDTPGVKNAWLQPTDEGEVPIYVNPERCELQYDRPRVFSTTAEAETEARLPLGGLYNICLEVEAEEEVDACGQVSSSVEEVLDRVRSALHRHRNLCEDFCNFIVLGDEEIAVCADIELTSEADPEAVLLTIYEKVQAFLSPELRFYSLKEMLAKGKRMEEIFAGRPLRPESHGFIDADELEQTELKEVLHVSDLYQVIMAIPGVRAIEKLIVTNYINDIAQTQGEEWCLNLTSKHRPTLDVERSRINFLKDSLPFGVNRGVVQQEYRERREASTKAFRSANELDRSIPTGTPRDIADYWSVQHEFPLAYGVGAAGPDLSGLDGEERQRRIAQARQLKGYLFFFDQILADYLTQLAHVRDLFSMRSDDDPARAGRTHTYFTQLLADVPDIEDLIRDVEVESGSNGIPSPGEVPGSSIDTAETGKLQEFGAYVARIAESPKTYYDRRNRFLDHLLARFAESFADYVLLMYRINGKRHDNEKIVRDKTRFLQSYPTTSRDRGKGFDYTDGGEIWDTTNIAGLKERVSRLMGIDDVRRRSLSHCDVVEAGGGFRFRVVQAGNLLAVSTSDYPDQTTAAEAFEAFLERGGEEQNYRRLAYEGFNHYGFSIVDDEGRVVADYPRLFAGTAERSSARMEFYRRMREEGPFAAQTVRKGGRYCFEISLSAAGPVIRGRERFREANEARRAGEQFLEWALDEAHYENRTVSGFTHYGYVLTDADGKPVVEAPELWASPAARDAGLLSLIGYVRDPAVDCSVIRAGECYFYVLFDGAFESGEDDPATHTLFTAQRGYPSAAEAEAAFYDTFLPIARQASNYERTYTEEGFGFVLRAPDTGVVVARHGRRYNTEQEREDRLHTIVLYLADLPLAFETPGREGVFRYEIRDPEDAVQLASRNTYPTEGQAEGACRAARRLARYRTYYQKHDDLGGHAPYGFELVDREGNLVAEHPRGYETDAARDEALDALIESAERSEEELLICFVDGTPGEFTFELYLPEAAGGRRLLFESIETFTERRKAEEAFQAFLRLAGDRTYYFMEDNFSFALREREDGVWGPVVAAHPRRYVSNPERDAAIDLIRAYVRDDPVIHELINTEGSYLFELTDKSGEVLLEGTETFPSVGAAEEGFDQFLEAAASTDRYLLTSDGPDPCPYGFELREAAGTEGEEGPASVETQGRRIAIHPRRYASADMRDARRDEIAAYAGGEDPAYQITGTDCGYYYEQECAGHRFRSVRRFPNEARAVEACIAASSYLSDEERYDLPDEEPWEDRLVVTDAEGAVVTAYVGPAQTPAELDDVPGEVAGAISAASEAEAAYEREPSGFLAQLKDRESGDILLRAPRIRTPVAAHSPHDQFDSPQAREDAVEYVVDALGDTEPAHEILEREEGHYFALLRNDEPVLIGRRSYDNSQDAEEAFEAFVQIGKDPANYHRFDLTADGTYGFEVFADASADEMKAAVCRDCNRTAERAQDPNHFRRITDGNACLFGFELVTESRQTLAEHGQFYLSESARMDRIEAIIDLVNDEGFHLIEHLLLRPRVPGSLSADGGDGETGDAFLPLTEGCLNEEGDICFLRSDPYSFRATVVLPYWPDRFREPSFRSFFERTMRGEAPAHVYLRICWVDTCQMHAFETAYRRWLRSRALPEYDCESTDALAHLLEVMCRLRNVYPEATLGACEAAAAGARVILNQTLLGTANPDRDDNS